MHESVVPDLAHRVERLERQNRRLRVAGVTVLLAIAAAGVMGQARRPAATLEAQRFVVKDAQGRARGVVGLLDGSAAVHLYDQSGKGRAGLTVAPEGLSRLGFYDRDGKGRVIVDVTGEGAATVGFFARDAKARAQLTMTPDGVVSLGFFDKAGQPAWPGRLLLP